MPPPPATDWRSVLVAHAALSTGLLAAFEEPATPAAAAAATGLDPRATRIVCAALVAGGLLAPAGEGRLRLTEDGGALVRPEGDRDPAGELLLEARSMRGFLRLDEALLTGRPLDDVSGGDRATRERFMRAMRAVAGPRADETAAAIGPPRGGGRLLDVGGAPGTYARRMAAEGWSVTVLDLPETLEIGEAGLREAGIAAVPGDATEEIPEGPWDVVYLGNVVHLFDPATAAALLARAGRSLAPGGTLAVQEVLGDLSPQGPSFGVMMLVSSAGGDAYGEADLRGWMAAAGCPVERVVPIADGWHHLLLGHRR